MKRSPSPPIRRAPYEVEHGQSTRRGRDRISERPTTLRQYLAWGQREYALEAPVRLHDRDIADDGSPDHTGEAKAFIGLSQGRDQAHLHHVDPVSGECPDCADIEPKNRPTSNDWIRVARRLDLDGYYVTPMRAAISTIKDPHMRRFAGELLCNAFTPSAVCEANDIPRWMESFAIERTMMYLWDAYLPRPMPAYQRKSEAQLDAEAA